MNAQELQEQIWDLRNEQANVTPEERAEIQEKIEELYTQIDSNS